MLRQIRFVFEQYKEKGGTYFEEVIKDAGHAPHIEKFDEFNALLRQFIKQNT